jgi:hypothetical protein
MYKICSCKVVFNATNALIVLFDNEFSWLGFGGRIYLFQTFFARSLACGFQLEQREFINPIEGFVL